MLSTQLVNSTPKVDKSMSDSLLWAWISTTPPRMKMVINAARAFENLSFIVSPPEIGDGVAGARMARGDVSEYFRQKMMERLERYSLRRKKCGRMCPRLYQLFGDHRALAAWLFNFDLQPGPTKRTRDHRLQSRGVSISAIFFRPEGGN